MAAPVIKAIIFDCFGVLYTGSATSIRDLAPEMQQQELTDFYAQSDHGYINREDFINAIARLTNHEPAFIQSRMNSQHTINTKLISYIKENLIGHYKIGLLSNIGRGWINDFFDEHELHELFDAVVLSGEEGVTKPDTAIFELMAAKLSLKTSECIMIDDMQENCIGAESAGMDAVHFTSNAQLLDVLGKKLSATPE